MAKVFEARFRALADHPLVGDVRCMGLIGAAELVADKGTKRPFDLKKLVGPKAAAVIQKNGLITRAVGDAVALCPPLIITEDQIHEIFDIYERSLDEVEAWVRSEELRAA